MKCKVCGEYTSNHDPECTEPVSKAGPIMEIEAIVELIREQGRLRSLENDEAGILFHHANRIQVEVDQLYGPTPFAGLDAHETE
jgi:hypothetical protein